jgi:filamentous hemagglutinin
LGFTSKDRGPVFLGTGEQITVVPDALGKTIVEIKDVVDLSISNQFRGYLAQFEATGQPIELIVSPNTKTISAPLIKLIKQTGGTIEVSKRSSKRLCE